MSYRAETILRILAFVGMLIFAISNSLDWGWGVVLGFMLWPWPLMFTIGPCLARLVPADFRRFWRDAKVPSEPIPKVVSDLAECLGTRPPKTMKVSPDEGINASVNRDAMRITEGLRTCPSTFVWLGVMAHEMAHLAGRHHRWMALNCVVSLCAVLVLVTLIGEGSWPIWLGVACTVLPVSIPVLARHQEYDADRRAARIVGTDTMTFALEFVADETVRKNESDTHPSIEKRLAKLRGKGHQKSR